MNLQISLAIECSLAFKLWLPICFNDLYIFFFSKALSCSNFLSDLNCHVTIGCEENKTTIKNIFFFLGGCITHFL